MARPTGYKCQDANRAILRELEELGVVRREVIPTSPPSVEYELTPLGQRFQPVLDAMIVVGKDLATTDGEPQCAESEAHAVLRSQ